MAKKPVHVPQAAWDRYSKIINEFMDNDTGRQPFTWLRKIEQPGMYAEDVHSKDYVKVELEGLFNYNFIKSWPTNPQGVAGELDNGNTVLYISSNYLGELGYLNRFGYWNLNWSEDRFIVNGKVYKPAGDTQVAQAQGDALLFYLILKREDEEETQNILDTYFPETPPENPYVEVQKKMVFLSKWNGYYDTNDVYTNTSFEVEANKNKKRNG